MKRVLGKVKSHVRDAAGESLRVSGLTSPAIWGRGRLTIVTFHRVLPPSLLAQYPMPGIAVTPDELDYFLRVFRQHYVVGSLRDMADRHAAGGRADKPLLAVTFDDGQLDNYLFARPVLQAHGVKASFYVVAAAADANEILWHDRMAFAIRAAVAARRDGLAQWLAELGVSSDAEDPAMAAVAQAKRLTPAQREARQQTLDQLCGGEVRPDWDGMMNWDHLRQMQREGHEIGSHSHSHPILPLVDDEGLQNEIMGSKTRLEQQLGREVVSFCYPNGDHDARVVAAVRTAGYRYAVTTTYGLNSRGADVCTMRRIDIQGRYGRNLKGDWASGALLMRLSGRLPGMS